MTCERVLSYRLDGKLRDTLELSLHNNVLGGVSLDGMAFAYENRLATCDDESTIRKPWFDSSSNAYVVLLSRLSDTNPTPLAACCPPNLARTMGIIGGYAWNAYVDPLKKRITLHVYLYISAHRIIPLPHGNRATVTMTSKMPWIGETTWECDAPLGWTWEISVPDPCYAKNGKTSRPGQSPIPGYIDMQLPATGALEQTFDMPVRLLTPHMETRQDTLTVSKGPLIYTAEAIDNTDIEDTYPHFEGVGLSSKTRFHEKRIEIHGFNVVQLVTDSKSPVYGSKRVNVETAYREVDAQNPAREWVRLVTGLCYTPWFARGNRGGNGHIRTAMNRVD